ncbi:MAG: DUF2442 domain-containing protein [Oscillospiraceae bacterium]|nr:DUF2442 domain-containing protein [Oscillospiraceae bacterium]
MEEALFPVVLQAIAGDDYTVYAYMLDGTVRKVSVKALVEQGGVFERLRDESFFREALTVMNDTVAWDLSGEHDPTNCIDIDPFTIAECEIVEDPIKAA